MSKQELLKRITAIETDQELSNDLLLDIKSYFNNSKHNCQSNLRFIEEICKLEVTLLKFKVFMAVNAERRDCCGFRGSDRIPYELFLLEFLKGTGYFDEFLFDEFVKGTGYFKDEIQVNNQIDDLFEFLIENFSSKERVSAINHIKNEISSSKFKEIRDLSQSIPKLLPYISKRNCTKNIKLLDQIQKDSNSKISEILTDPSKYKLYIPGEGKRFREFSLTVITYLEMKYQDSLVVERIMVEMIYFEYKKRKNPIKEVIYQEKLAKLALSLDIFQRHRDMN